MAVYWVIIQFERPTVPSGVLAEKIKQDGKKQSLVYMHIDCSGAMKILY